MAHVNEKPKIFLEAMFVIIQNWKQSTCVLLFKRLGRFAYADLKNLQDVLLREKSKHRMIYTIVYHLFEIVSSLI